MVILVVVYSWLYHITFKPSYWNPKITWFQLLQLTHGIRADLWQPGNLPTLRLQIPTAILTSAIL